MINDVDETLRLLLLGEIGHSVTDTEWNDVSILFNLPSTVHDTGTPYINLYLHDIRENLKQREEFFQIKRKPDNKNIAGWSKSAIRLDLAYLLTTHAKGDQLKEHMLLSDTLGVLLKNNIVPERYLAGKLSGQGKNAIQLSVVGTDHPSHIDLPALWMSIGERIRPSITLIATIFYDPFETKWTRVVREALIGVYAGTGPVDRAETLQIHSTKVSIAGIVTTSSEQMPLDEVKVKVSGMDAQTVTDEKGFFYLMNLPPGPTTLEFELPGFHPQLVNYTIDAIHIADLEPIVVRMEPLSGADWSDNNLALTWTVNRSGLLEKSRHYSVTLSGRVTYSDGQPAAYITVHTDNKQTITDAAGVYIFTNLREGKHEVFAELPGYGEVALNEFPGGGTLILPSKSD